MLTIFQHVPRIQVLLATDHKNYNTPMNDIKLQAVKGLDNPLEIQILNSDRRPVKLLGKTVRFVLSKTMDNSIYLEKDMTIVDVDKAIYRADLASIELEDVPTGLAQIAFYVEDVAGKRTPLTKNLAGKFAVDINVVDGPYMIPQEDVKDDFGLVSTQNNAVEDFGSVTDYTEQLEDEFRNTL